MKQSSGFYIITAAVMHDKNLSNDEKILFAALTGLSEKYGYAFASNEYLCDLINVEERTLQRLLHSLEQSGYIHRKIEKDKKDPFKTVRKIFISTSKLFLRDDTGDTLGNDTCDALDMSPVTPIIDNNTYNKKEKTSEAEASAKPSQEAQDLAVLLLSSIQKIKPDVKQPNLSKWSVEIHRMISIDKRSPDQIAEIIEKLPTMAFWSKNILSADKLRQHFDKLQLSVDNDRDKASKTSPVENLVKKIIEKYSNHPDIVLGRDYIEFRRGVHCDHIRFDDNGAEEQIRNALRKRELSV